MDDGDNCPGTKAVYSCNDGFELVGDRKRLCQGDGTWYGEAPTCESKEIEETCDILVVNSQGLIFYTA